VLDTGSRNVGTRIWFRYLVFGVIVYPAAFISCDVWGGDGFLGGANAPTAALVLTGATLVFLAAWYWMSVARMTGSGRGAWSLPDSATVEVRLDPALALRRLRTVAESAYPWVLASDANPGLVLTKTGGQIGNSSVRVDAEAIHGGARLHFRAGSPMLINNGISRAMIAGLVERISAGALHEEQA
jgi:hypothetical protein